MRKNHITELENTILLKLHSYINKNEKVNIDTLATECFVSKAAIVKLAKKLGYSGYTEMRFSMMEHQSKIFGVDCSPILDSSKNQVLQQYVDKLCELLFENRDRKIYLDSLGLCDSARDYYYNRLLMFGFDVVISYHVSTFRVSEPGIFFFLSFSGSRPEKLDVMKTANEYGFTTIALTTSGKSPMAQAASYAIEIEGIRTPNHSYQPNLFVPNLIVLLELVLSRYSELHLRAEARTL